MARVLRGEIYWAELGATRGRKQSGVRPVLVISHDVFNARSGTAIVVALTSRPQQAGFPLTMPVVSVHLPKRSWIKVSQIRTLSTERLGKRAGALSPEELNWVVEGLFELVG